MGAGRNREEGGRQRPALDFMGAPGYQYLSLLRSDSSFSDIYTPPPTYTPLSIRTQVPRLAWHFSGPVPWARGASTQGPTEGVAPGNCGGDLFVPPHLRNVLSLQACLDSCAGSQPYTAHCMCPVGTRFASPSKGWRLAARACCHTPEPHTRGQAAQTGGRPLLFPPSPLPHRASRLRPCWNVTGVVARACPDSRNTCFSPQGFPQPPALVRWMAEAELLMPGRPPEVAASTGPCGGCCPRAAA